MSGNDDEEQFGLVYKYVFPEPRQLMTGDRFKITMVLDERGYITDCKITDFPKLHQSDKKSLRRSIAMMRQGGE